VEDWTIENRTGENHEFHQHQIHFLWRAQNGVPVSQDQQQFLDMIQVPYWSGSEPKRPIPPPRNAFRGAQTNEVAARDLVKDAPDLCGRIGAQIGIDGAAPGGSRKVEISYEEKLINQYQIMDRGP
jgi:hypothetical protein